MGSDSLITLQGVNKVYATQALETHALRNVNLAIRRGEFVAIAGPSGCGKSTLLALIGLLDTATSGSYRLDGRDVSTLDRDERAIVRNREIGFVFQSYNLISDLTVYENIELPLTFREDLSAAQIRERVDYVLGIVDMRARRDHFPAQLSGGQQQRVAVARALGGTPSLLLADEPCGNLDSKNAEGIMLLLEELHRQGTTICMVTHDAKSARRAQRYIELCDGQVVVDEVLEIAREAVPGKAPACG